MKTRFEPLVQASLTGLHYSSLQLTSALQQHDGEASLLSRVSHSMATQLRDIPLLLLHYIG